MEALQKKGFAKFVLHLLAESVMLMLPSFRSIGVSNFGVEDLKILLASAKIKPVANQVRWRICHHSIGKARLISLLDFVASLRLRATSPHFGVLKTEWSLSLSWI